ncbi:MAG: TAXI family TRAP transporter solute-binding subunit [Candidatus Aerophobetes bacterium]|nr:TAXI family TRAP transporter solute-binding subunit [Candidatus Aerophobetes bacterium]
MYKNLLKKIGGMLVSSFLVVMLLSGFAAAQKEDVSLLITTATTGGTYYPVGVGMATLWTTKLKDQGIRVAAQSSAGSAENIEMLRGKEVDLAILQGLFGKMVWRGTGVYKGRACKTVRSITMLWPNTEHFVLIKSKAKTGNVMDMKGTRFSIGRAGSGTERSTLTIMKGLGMSRESVKGEYLGYFESATAIKDRRIEGASLVAGPPVAAVTDLFATPGVDVVILEFTDKQLEAINEKTAYPGFRYLIPADTYPGQTESVNSIAQPNYLGVREGADEDIVYLLTKTIFENLDYLHGVHKATEYIKLKDALSGLPVPLHPGAMRYYKEMGLKIPESLIPPEAK